MRSVGINRLSLTAILATVVCLLLLIPGAYGQGFTLQVTENPLDPLNQLNGVFHPGFLQNDPGPGGLPNALTYTTPAGLVVGDLLIHEPSGQESDLIRWNDNATLVFYSDLPQGEPPEIPPDAADIGLPTGSYPNGLSVIETGVLGYPYSETGWNGYVYTPLAGQPGYNPAAPGSTYIIISDVPEPTSLMLVVVGLVGALMIRRRKV
jgi:hypothetical protein